MAKSELGGRRKTDVVVESEFRQPLVGSTEIHRRCCCWLSVAIYFFLLVAGCSAATILRRIYHPDLATASLWLHALAFYAAFPVIIVARLVTVLLFPSVGGGRSTGSPVAAAMLIGILSAATNFLDAYGGANLPASTFALVGSGRQVLALAFSFVFKLERISAMALNSAAVFTFSAALSGMRRTTEGELRPLALAATASASVIYSVTLAVTEITFRKVLKRRGLAAVLDLQICSSFSAALVVLIGLSAHGDWYASSKALEGVSEKITYTGMAFAWQAAGVGVIGLIAEVSSLFANCMSGIAPPAAMLVALAVPGCVEKMDGVKVISLSLAAWGTICYCYQLLTDNTDISTDDGHDGAGNRELS